MCSKAQSVGVPHGSQKVEKFLWAGSREEASSGSQGVAVGLSQNGEQCIEATLLEKAQKQAVMVSWDSFQTLHRYCAETPQDASECLGFVLCSCMFECIGLFLVFCPYKPSSFWKAVSRMGSPRG